MREFAKKHIAKAERFLAAADNDCKDGYDKSPKTHSDVINVLWNNRDKFQDLKESDITKLTQALNKRVESGYVVDEELPDESDAEEVI